MTEDQTEHVPPHRVRHGDVIQNPDTSRWLTVTRVIHGGVTVSEGRGNQRRERSTPLWTFRGDDRLDEEITVASDDVLIVRRRSG